MMEPYYAKKMLATKTYHHKGTEDLERDSHKSIEKFASTMARNVGLTYQKHLNKERNLTQMTSLLNEKRRSTFGRMDSKVLTEWTMQITERL